MHLQAEERAKGEAEAAKKAAEAAERARDAATANAASLDLTIREALADHARIGEIVNQVVAFEGISTRPVIERGGWAWIGHGYSLSWVTREQIKQDWAGHVSDETLAVLMEAGRTKADVRPRPIGREYSRQA